MGGPEIVIPIMGIFWPFTALIVFIVVHYSSKNKIRMALIESGRDASIFKRSRTGNRLRSLKTGVVCVMIGMGTFLGFLLSSMGMPPEIALVTCIFICVGLGLVGFYIYTTKQVDAPEEIRDMV